MNLITLLSLASLSPETHLARAITYRDIKPILTHRCYSCHNPTWPSHNWNVYDMAYKNRYNIQKRVFKDKSMPPAGLPMTNRERRLINDWVEDGGKP